jgi:hypothetical protein
MVPHRSARQNGAVSKAARILAPILAALLIASCRDVRLGASEAEWDTREALAWVGSGLSLVAIIALCLRVRAGPLRTIGLLLLWYLAFELFAAPQLVRRFGLTNYLSVRDPDHRPWSAVPDPEWNSDGLRGVPERVEFLPEDLNLIFLGDSFTYGQGIDESQQVFPALVQELLAQRMSGRVRVANFGWTSSSPFLSYRRLREIGPAYHPDLVALFVDMTDFHDDIKWRNMLERKGIYWFYDKIPVTLKVLESAVPSLYWRWWTWSNEGAPRQRYFITEAPLSQTRRFMEPMLESIDAIDAFCAERSIPFVMFILPRYYQYSNRECPQDRELSLPGRQHSILGPYCLEPFRFFEELSRPYPIISLLEAFADSEVFPHCFAHDPHWNEAGHAIAAEAIAEHMLGILAEEPSR